MGEYKYVDKRKNNSAKITNKNIEKTDMGWVDLSNLVNYPYHINWDKSIGKIVPFQYDDICAELIISERDDNRAGSVVVASIEGTRPLLIEIQALTSQTVFGLPRRTANGIDYNRLTLLIAVLEKKAGLPLGISFRKKHT